MPIQVVQTLMVAIQTTKQVYITAIKFDFTYISEKKDSHKRSKYMAVLSFVNRNCNTGKVIVFIVFV